MTKSSFATQKSLLDDVCQVLRSFTLGKLGVTRRDGATGIQRVNEQCERVSKLFASGPHAQQAARIVASARTRIAAAEARLALLEKRA